MIEKDYRVSVFDSVYVVASVVRRRAPSFINGPPSDVVLKFAEIDHSGRAYRSVMENVHTALRICCRYWKPSSREREDNIFPFNNEEDKTQIKVKDNSSVNDE